MIEVLTTGAANSVQDLGRFGYLDAGVSRSGAMDAPALELANCMIGNDANAAAIEVAIFPFRLRFNQATLVAVTGADCPVTLNGIPYPSWWALPVRTGDVLELGLPRSGARAYVAVSGGLGVPAVLGSASTDLKSGWGGLEGRGLRRGDRLDTGFAPMTAIGLPAGFGLDPSEIGRSATDIGEDRPIRILPGAEYGSFEPAAVAGTGSRRLAGDGRCQPPGLSPVRPRSDLDAKARTAFARHHAGHRPGAAVGPADHPARRGQYLRRLSEDRPCDRGRSLAARTVAGRQPPALLRGEPGRGRCRAARRTRSDRPGRRLFRPCPQGTRHIPNAWPRCLAPRPEFLTDGARP